MLVPAWGLEAVAHTQRVSLEENRSGETTPRPRCHSPVMSTSERGCSFLQDGTNTVMSVWPRSRNQFTARRIPRQEKTSLFPWLGRRGGQGQPAFALASPGGRWAALQPLPWQHFQRPSSSSSTLLYSYLLSHFSLSFSLFLFSVQC